MINLNAHSQAAVARKNDFAISFENYRIFGDTILNSEQKVQLLCLHGGAGDRSRFNLLRELLAQRNIGSCAFDFIGHGESFGDISRTSLSHRLLQTRAVISNQKISDPVTLIASSMGGYIAIKLLPLIPVQNLILIAPAVYATRAFTLPFGPQFSSTIREQKSWLRSDAWDILNSFQGNLLLFTAEFDHVVPKELTDKIYQSSTRAKFREQITIAGAEHSLIQWLNHNPDQLTLVTNKIIQNLTHSNAQAA